MNYPKASPRCSGCDQKDELLNHTKTRHALAREDQAGACIWVCTSCCLSSLAAWRDSGGSVFAQVYMCNLVMPLLILRYYAGHTSAVSNINRRQLLSRVLDVQRGTWPHPCAEEGSARSAFCPTASAKQLPSARSTRAPGAQRGLQGPCRCAQGHRDGRGPCSWQPCARASGGRPPRTSRAGCRRF